MDLLVVRHAIAEDRRPGLPDARRALTPRGRRRMQRAVAGLRRLDARLDRIEHSPLRRAVQTAQLLEPLLRRGGALHRCEALARAPADDLLRELTSLIHCDRVAVVGHEPWTGELVAWLVLGTPRGAPAFALRKGGVAWLRGKPEPAGMRVVALLAPSVLRGLARD